MHVGPTLENNLEIEDEGDFFGHGSGGRTLKAAANRLCLERGPATVRVVQRIESSILAETIQP